MEPNQTSQLFIAEICKSAGFTSCSKEALNLISIIFENYLFDLFLLTKKYAETCQRTRANLNDLRLTFAHFGLNSKVLFEYFEKTRDQKFISSSRSLSKELPHPELKSFIVNDFRYDFPSQASNSNHSTVSSNNHNNNQLPKYVSSYCPSFPSVHTFKRSKVSLEYEKNVSILRQLQANQSRMIQENLRKLLQSGKGTFEDGEIIINYKRHQQQKRKKNRCFI